LLLSQLRTDSHYAEYGDEAIHKNVYWVVGAVRFKFLYNNHPFKF